MRSPFRTVRAQRLNLLLWSFALCTEVPVSLCLAVLNQLEAVLRELERGQPGPSGVKVKAE